MRRALLECPPLRWARPPAGPYTMACTCMRCCLSCASSHTFARCSKATKAAALSPIQHCPKSQGTSIAGSKRLEPTKATTAKQAGASCFRLLPVVPVGTLSALPGAPPSACSCPVVLSAAATNHSRSIARPLTVVHPVVVCLHYELQHSRWRRHAGPTGALGDELMTHCLTGGYAVQ